MKKQIRCVVVVFCLIFFVSFQISCARKYVRLDVKDLASLKPQRLTHSTYPHIRGYHSGMHAAGTALVFLALVPGIVVSQIASHKDRDLSRDIASAGMPDMGKLLVNKFAARAHKELPNWPVPLAEEQSQLDWKRYVKEFKADGSGSLIIFFIEYKFLTTGSGLKAYFKAVMWSAEGDIIWLKGFEYSSKDYGRKRSLEEYKAGNFMLLKEELEFATDKAVSEFIASISKGYDEEMLKPTSSHLESVGSIDEFNEIEQPEGTPEEMDQSLNETKEVENPAVSSEETGQPTKDLKEIKQPVETDQSVNESKGIEQPTGTPEVIDQPTNDHNEKEQPASSIEQMNGSTEK